MRDLEAIKADIRSREKTIEDRNKVTNALRDERKVFEQEYAEKSCPFKVGHPMVDKDGNKATVTTIYFGGLGKYSEPYGFKVLRIKGNGEPYKNECAGGLSCYWTPVENGSTDELGEG